MSVKFWVLPHPVHKKRSYLLQHKAFIGYIVFLLAIIFLTQQITVRLPNVLGYAENISISDLLGRTNSMRSESGLSSLNLNSTLSKAAEAKANDMFEKDYWSHTSPDGKEPWDFIIASGYDYLYAGENLAVDFSDSGDVVSAWYDSPSHRENLLNEKYTEIGFAVVNGELEGRKTTLVVQMFGYPRTRPASIASAETEQEAIETEVVEEVPEAAEAEPVPESISEEAVIIEETEPVSNVETGPPVQGSVLNSSAVFNVSRSIALVLGLFLTAMFAIDGYYVRKMGIFRVSGHTILHLLMLLAAIAGIWYTQIGLVL